MFPIQAHREGSRPHPWTKRSAPSARRSRILRVRLCSSLPQTAAKVHCDRFFGLFGVYYSLQYLSLSDATVLTFLAPMCTAVTGAVLLHEQLSWREAFAGREYMRPVRLLCHVAHGDIVQWPA